MNTFFVYLDIMHMSMGLGAGRGYTCVIPV